MIKTETLGLLRKYGISIYSSLDEQQLIDTRIIRTLIEAGEISPSDTVLEVGPGLGNITIKLMEMNCRVVAIEKNPKFIPILHERLCTNDNIEIIQGDVLKMPLPIFHVLISNTPYAIVEALMQRLKHVSFKIASIIVPKNFASILLADNSSSVYSKLSYTCQLFFKTRKVMKIPIGAYYPESNTETEIISVKPKTSENLKEEIMRSLLMQEDRKTGNALREALISLSQCGYPSTKKKARDMITHLEIPIRLLNKRVARLNLAELNLLDRLFNNFIH